MLFNKIQTCIALICLAKNANATTNTSQVDDPLNSLLVTPTVKDIVVIPSTDNITQESGPKPTFPEMDQPTHSYLIKIPNPLLQLKL